LKSGRIYLNRVSTSSSSAPPKPSANALAKDFWIKIGNCTITKAQEDELLTDGPRGCIGDDLMFALVQFIRRNSTKGGVIGLQNTIFVDDSNDKRHHQQGTLMPNSYEEVTMMQLNDFNNRVYIQILHTGNFHWVTAYADLNAFRSRRNKNDPLSIIIYDSAPDASINNTVRNQLRALFNINVGLRVTLGRCDKQNDSYRCGVFATAFAIALSTGEEVEKLKFDVNTIRRDLHGAIDSMDVRSIHLRK
jgi:hypothetical protein